MEFFLCPHGRFFDRNVEITHLDVPIRAVSSLSLYLGWFGLGIGGLFLDLLQRWSNRSRFCGKHKEGGSPASRRGNVLRARK